MFFIFVFIVLNTLSAFAGPSRTTYQAKIVKPDGYPLEASSVNFKFTILNPAGSCILYSETYSSVNMASTGGLISFALGSGVKTYPTSATTFEQVFSNITPNLSCDAGGPVNYSPSANDTRKIVMQFHDGSGWQTLPAMAINAVPYAMYANEAQKLNGKSDSDFVQVSTVPSCTASEALRFNGAAFSCVAVGTAATPVTSGSVITALGYTPADGVSLTTLTSTVASANSVIATVSSTVFSVSSTVTSLQNSVAASFASITSSQWVTSGSAIYYLSGRVGIGTSNPAYSLDIEGATRIQAHLNSTSSGAFLRLNYGRGTSETPLIVQNTDRLGGMTFQAYDGLGTYQTAARIEGFMDGPVSATSMPGKITFSTTTSNSITVVERMRIDSNGNVGIGVTNPATKLDVSGGVRIGTESSSCSAALAGTLRYNGGAVEYCNGASWAAFGVSGAGLTLLNGSASNTQTFANGTTGNSPAFNTANGVHTLNIPLASATGSVTAGLISNADYVNFSNKITSSAASIAAVLGYAPVSSSTLGNYLAKTNNLSDLTSSATARTNLGLGTFATANSIDLGSTSATGTLAAARLPSFAGDVTSVSGSNTLTLANSGVSAATYTKVTVDSKGRVTSGSQLTSSDVTTALGYTPGAAASGVTLLNGSSSQTQTFANGTTGTTPAFVTANGVHTLNIPLASAATVTGGLLSNADYTTFMGKIASSAASIAQVLGYTPAASGSLTSSQWTNSGANIYFNSGLVGIGTSTPTVGRKLHVNDSTATSTYIKVSNASATNGLDLGVNSVGQAVIYQRDNKDLVIGTSDTQRMIVQADGLVGIGTSAPQTELHVNDGGGTTAEIRLTNSVTGVGATDGFNVRAQNLDVTLNNFEAGDMLLATNNSERLRITSAGKVGIGTSSPTGLLHVVRSAGTTIGQTSSQTANAGLIIEGGATGLLAFDGNEIQQFGDTLNMRGSDGINFSAGDAAYGDAVTAMTINRLGKIGFGTSNPQTYYHFNKGTTMGSVTSLNLNASVLRITESASTSLNFDGNTIAAEDDLYIGTKSGGVFQFFASDTVKAVINTNGFGIGVGAPTARLHLASGTTSLAPMKFNSGTLLTAAAAGSVEYDGFNLYYTDGTNTRRMLASSLGSGSVDNASTINATGNITMVPNSSVIVSSTTASTDSTTGALIVKGGLGVAGNIYSSGTIVTSSNIQGSEIYATSATITPYVYGSTASGGALRLESTTNAGKGNIYLAAGGGNVAVGNVTPTSPLHVIGSANSSTVPWTTIEGGGSVLDNIALRLYDRGTGVNNNNILEFAHSAAGPVPVGTSRIRSNNATTNSATGSNLFLETASDSSGTWNYYQLSLYRNGNIGVGVSAPTYLMDMYGSASPTLRIRSASNDPANGPNIRLTEDTAENGGVIRYHSVNNTLDLGVVESGVEKTGLSINRSSGNVGIGVSNPVARLSIEQSGPVALQMKTTGAAAADTMNLINDMDANGNFWFAKGSAASATPTSANRLVNITNEGVVEIYGQAVNGVTDHSGILALKTQASTDGGNRSEASLEFYSNNSNLNTRTGYIGYETNDANMSVMPVTGSLILGANSTEIARVTSTGVGIGTTAPTNKFEVIGAAVIGSGNGTYNNNSNYVFGNSNTLYASNGGSIGTGLHVFGYSNSVWGGPGTGWNGVLVGRSNTVSGTSGNPAIFGFSNNLTNSANSMIFGFGSSSTAMGTFTFGQMITNTVASSLQIGMNNMAKITILGTGATSGNVGINTTAPKARLTVVDGASSSSIPAKGQATNTQLLVSNADQTYGFLFGSLQNGTAWMQSQRTDGVAQNSAMYIQPNGGDIQVGGGNTGPLGTVWPGLSTHTYGTSNTLAYTDNVNITARIFGDWNYVGRTNASTAAGYVTYYAIGASNTMMSQSSNVYKMAIGFNNTVPDQAGSNIIIGTGITTAGTSSVVIGMGSPLLNIAASGTVGIGTTTPQYKLDVSGGARLVASNGADIWTERSDSDIDIRGANSNRNRTFSIHASASNTDVINFYANNAGSFIQAMAIKNVTGYVGVLNSSAAYPLDVGGSVNIAGGASLRFGGSTVVCTSAGCTASSDRRLKENIKPLDFSLEKLLSLNAVQYDWKDKAKFGSQHEIGFIAQDLEKVYPEVVRTDKESGFKSVSYDKLAAPIIEALKEFNARIMKLFDRTEEHSREIASIKEENAELKSRVEKTEQENKELKERLDRIEQALIKSNSK